MSVQGITVPVNGIGKLYLVNNIMLALDTCSPPMEQVLYQKVCSRAIGIIERDMWLVLMDITGSIKILTVATANRCWNNLELYIQ